MEFQWEVYQPDPGLGDRERVRVTLNPRGNFYLNAPAHKALGHPEAVIMMYDRRRSIIGLSSASIDQRGAYRLKKKGLGSSNGRMLYATTFCKKFGVRSSETIVFTEASINKDGILILDLNTIATATRK